MAEFKPKFVLSDRNILLNLHQAGYQEMQEKYTSASNILPNKPNFANKYIINSGIDPDKIKQYLSKDGEGAFDNNKYLYEIAINFDISNNSEIKDHDTIASKDLKTLDRQSLDEIDKIKKDAYDILMVYMKKFAGSENANRIKESDLITTIYDNLDDAIKINNFSIGTKDKKNNSNLPTGSMPALPDKILILQFKFGYSIGLQAKH